MATTYTSSSNNDVSFPKSKLFYHHYRHHHSKNNPQRQSKMLVTPCDKSTSIEVLLSLPYITNDLHHCYCYNSIETIPKETSNKFPISSILKLNDYDEPTIISVNNLEKSTKTTTKSRIFSQPNNDLTKSQSNKFFSSSTIINQNYDCLSRTTTTINTKDHHQNHFSPLLLLSSSSSSTSSSFLSMSDTSNLNTLCYRLHSHNNNKNEDISNHIYKEDAKYFYQYDDKDSLTENSKKLKMSSPSSSIILKQNNFIIHHNYQLFKMKFPIYFNERKKKSNSNGNNGNLILNLILFLILFTSQCNTQLIISSSNNNSDNNNHKNIRSLTDATTTEHSKINPYTFDDYNQLIRRQAFNSPTLYCGDPPLVPNAQSNLHRHQKHYVFPLGQEAIYLCEQGYKAVSGNSETKCMIEGVRLSNDNHGQFIFPDVFNSNSNSPSQSVRQGSNRSKNSKRLSDLDEEPDVNANGAKIPITDFVDKKKMSRKSDDELYELEGQPNIKKIQARWLPPITLNCQLVNCTDPGQVAHAKRNDPKSGILSFNSNVHYVCDDGYETIGIPFLTCRANGTWNRSPPQCRLKQCEMLPALKNGNILYSDSDRRTNSRAEYRCDPGYRLNAATTTRLCNGDDKWSLLEPLLYMSNVNNNSNQHSLNDSYQCLPITCPTPVSPHNSLRIVHVNRKQRTNKLFVPGDIIIYNCNSNRMRATAKCGSDGEWSQGMPHCPEDDFSSLKCSPISSFTHGSVRVDKNKAIFSCNEGYELDGGNSIQCNPMTGIWNGPMPRCVVRLNLSQKNLLPTTTNNSMNTSHSPILLDGDSQSEKQESKKLSKTVMVLLVLIFIVLLILIGIAAVTFYRWRQRKLNSKTWQRYFGHYYHRQSKTNIVLSTHFVNGHGHSNGATIGSTGSSNANACLLQRGNSGGSHSKGFSKSSGYLQSSFSSADENNADMKSFTNETVTSDRARTISTYVDDTCVEDDELYDEDEDNISIYKSTTFPITKQHNSMPLDILTSTPTSSSSSSNTDNPGNNPINAAKRIINSGNQQNDHIYQNMFQPLAPIIVSPNNIDAIKDNNNLPKFNKLLNTNGDIPVTDL